MPKKCCVQNCANKKGHIFPIKEEIRDKWLHAVGRNRNNINKTAVVCSKHFAEEDYIKEGYYSGMKNSKKILKRNAIPSLHLCNNLDKNKKSFGASKTIFSNAEDKINKNERSTRNVTKDESIVPLPDSGVNSQKKILSHDVSTQTSTNSQLFSASKFTHNDEAIHFYTGLETYSNFVYVLQSLGPNRFKMKYKHGQILSLSVDDQFLLTLMKLRRNYTNFELSHFFDISLPTVSDIIHTWIEFMALQWGELDLWPARKLPEHIKNLFSQKVANC